MLQICTNIITMKGFIEIKEDSYEDTIEHLHRIKLLACKLIKMLSEHSEVYDKDDDYEDEDYDMRDRYSERSSRKSKGRYNY